MKILILSLLIIPFMTNDTLAQTRFTAQELPYAYDALAPHLSEETLRFHHDKHYVGYVAKLNELILDTPYANQPLEDIIRSASGPIFNNAAQAWNHAFYFAQLSPKPQPMPSGALLTAIDKSFGSFEAMQKQMTQAAIGLFGSGWVWLVENKAGGLQIVSSPNAGNPLLEGLHPLMCIDVWEHAYYIDYRNRRADAVAALWNVIDWREVGERYAKR
ncbi:MAG: superoxide dismutase [Alistipes sp.]